MADVVEKKIEGKLRLLKFNNEQTTKTIERHVSVLESIIEKVHELKLEAQEIKFESGDEIGKVRLWTETIETELGKFENITKDVRHVVSEIKRKEGEKLDEEKCRRVLEDEIELEKAKLEVRSKFEASPKASSVGEMGAKLPKLVISKFQGNHLDWVRFWNQFETEIDKSNITQVAKLSYLRELLMPNARVMIEGLPFSSEGYERAKAILYGQISKTKYGQISEVINAHIQCILGLPKLHGTEPAKVHKFYETLASHVQTLETLGKLKEIGGFVRGTLDKLPGIRPDLVRLDDDWQQWGFVQLVESLRKWCDRNPIQPSDRKGDIVIAVVMVTLTKQPFTKFDGVRIVMARITKQQSVERSLMLNSVERSLAKSDFASIALAQDTEQRIVRASTPVKNVMINIIPPYVIRYLAKNKCWWQQVNLL